MCVSTRKVLFHISPFAVCSSILHSNHWGDDPQNQLTVTTYLNENRKLIIIHNGPWTQWPDRAINTEHATFPNIVQIFPYFVQNKHVVRHDNLTSGQQKTVYYLRFLHICVQHSKFEYTIRVFHSWNLACHSCVILRENQCNWIMDY